MPDVMWMIPVFARGSSLDFQTTPFHTGYPGTSSLHVDWNMQPYPAGAALEGVSVDGMAGFTDFPVGPLLSLTTGAWSWNTIFCNESVVHGAQLTVSVPFTRQFDIWDTDELSSIITHYVTLYKKIEVWIKYMPSPIGSGSSNLSSIRLALSDEGGHAPIVYDREYKDVALPGAWNVAYFTYTFVDGEDALWSNANLRFNAIFKGPVTGTIPESSSVGVEWIAIGLSVAYDVQDPPTPPTPLL